MPHIHSEPGQYDLTASAVIIRRDLPEPKVFLARHLLSGKWTQPGGHVELHESPWPTVQHEITEESGYTLNQLNVLQPKARIKDLGSDAILEPMPVCLMTYELDTHRGHFHTDIVFAFTTDSEPSEEILEDESTDVGYFSRSEIVIMSSSEIPDNVRQVILFVFEECLPNWEAIPAGAWRADS